MAGRRAGINTEVEGFVYGEESGLAGAHLVAAQRLAVGFQGISATLGVTGAFVGELHAQLVLAFRERVHTLQANLTVLKNAVFEYRPARVIQIQRPPRGGAAQRGNHAAT